MGGKQPCIGARSPSWPTGVGTGWTSSSLHVYGVTAAPVEPYWQVRYALQYFRLGFMVF